MPAELLQFTAVSGFVLPLVIKFPILVLIPLSNFWVAGISLVIPRAQSSVRTSFKEPVLCQSEKCNSYSKKKKKLLSICVHKEDGTYKAHAPPEKIGLILPLFEAHTCLGCSIQNQTPS